MHVWYHKKDNLILFKMIPYLLWFFHQGKGSISKYGITSQLKSCKMNTMQWSWSVHKEHVFCVQLCLLFSAGQLINTQQHEDAVPGGAVVQALGSSTRYWALVMSLKSMNTDEIKDPCDNKHENLCKSSPCHLIFMPVLVNVVNVMWD